MKPSIKQFYSKSAKKDDLGLDYDDWRKYLSNFTNPAVDGILIPDPLPSATGEYVLRYYHTVEHYFQGAKYLMATNQPEHFLNFNSSGTIDNDPRIAKQAGSRKAMRALHTTLDIAAWNSVKNTIMETAIQSRVEQDELFRTILLETRTRNIYLLHFERSGANSYWGGSLNKQTVTVKGLNILGGIIMKIRDSL
tara:strand:- start:602 stop:1183 length:582 start_codon:yes stop_codon:yes gene_type:complete